MGQASRLERFGYWPMHPPSDADLLASYALARGEVPTDPRQRRRLLRTNKRLRAVSFALVGAGCVASACSLADAIVGHRRVVGSVVSFVGLAMIGSAAHRRVRLLNGERGPDVVLRAAALAIAVAVVLGAGVTAAVELSRPPLIAQVADALRNRLPAQLDRLDHLQIGPGIASHLTRLTCRPQSSNSFFCDVTYIAGDELRGLQVAVFCDPYRVAGPPTLSSCGYTSTEPLLPQGTL